MRQNPKARARLALLQPADQIMTCTIVRGEILFGIRRLPVGQRQQNLLRHAEAIFAVIPCDAINPSVAEKYADIKCAFEKEGTALGENDLWIAATAIDQGAVLVTRDQAFGKIAGLLVQDWTV
jgi:tRNA(fMet)-specific endonuclease VapC